MPNTASPVLNVTPFDPTPVTRASIQSFDDTRSLTRYVLQVALAADEAPPWWSAARDLYLHKFWPSEPYLSGAIYSVAARNAALQYEFLGPDDAIADAQRLAVHANVGKGWQNLVLKLSLDLYTIDNGCHVEIIRPTRVVTEEGETRAVKTAQGWHAVTRHGKLVSLAGKSYTLKDSPYDLPIGIAHLDSLRTCRTGDPEFPITYTNLDGTVHKLRWWQVFSMEDLPSPRREMNDVGHCATGRALRLAQTLRDMLIYKHEKVSGRFTRAVHLTNIDPQIIQDAIEEAHASDDNRGLMRYSQPIVAATLDPNATPALVTIPLASMPDGFDEETAMRWYIAGLALDFGVDYGFLAPLPGNKLGTSQQAEVAERQSRGKASKLFTESLQDKINHSGILPRDVWFQFREVDAREEMERDTARQRRAQTRAVMIQSGELMPAQARQMAMDDGDYDDTILDVEDDTVPVEQTDGTDGTDKPQAQNQDEPNPKRFFWPQGKQPRQTAMNVSDDNGKSVKQDERNPPPTREQALTSTSTYVTALLTAYDAWLSKWPKRLATKRKSRRAIRQSARELEDELQTIADDLLLGAFLLGWGSDITPEGAGIVSEWATRNKSYLHDSLNPAITDALTAIPTTDWNADTVSATLGTFRHRVSLYAQPHWVLTWKGLEERVKATDDAQPIAWVLDPDVENCATCMDYAKTYPSLDAMIAITGGVPGDPATNTDCLPACHCSLELR